MWEKYSRWFADGGKRTSGPRSFKYLSSQTTIPDCVKRIGGPEKSLELLPCVVRIGGGALRGETGQKQ